MRKLLCIFLCLCSFIGILGCSANESVPENSVTVFYKREARAYGTVDSVIAETYMDATGHEGEHIYLINQYLQSAPSDGFASPFPQGIKLVGYKLEGLTVKVVLSDRIANLSGMDLTIALTCLTQTIMSITGCQEVILSAATKQLDGQNFITLNRDSYLLLDDSGSSQQ